MAERLEQGTQALKSLSVHFVSYMIEEGTKGQKLDRILSGFSRHRSKIVGGIVGGAGLAGGAWAAAAMWAGSIGIWGKFALAAGFAATPMWVPVAGSVAGLTAAGGAVMGYLSLARTRGKRRQLQSIIGFSKLFLGIDGSFSADDERLMRRFLSAKKVRGDEADELLGTSPDTARRLAGSSLSAADRREVARYIFPMVYLGDGVISASDRRRFRRVCRELGLNADISRSISQDYRARLTTQWDFLSNMIMRLNYFAHALGFDSREMELLREQLEQLTREAAPPGSGRSCSRCWAVNR